MKLSSAVLLSAAVLVLVQAACCAAAGKMPLYESKNGGLYMDGKRVHLRGASWFGFETDIYAVHGLWAVSMDSVLDKMASIGINALRLPLSAQMVLTNPAPGSMNPSVNPQFSGAGVRALQVLDALVAAAGQRGMLIMFDMHSLAHDSYMSDGLWYTADYPEARVVQMWDTLLARYNRSWNVFAADLKNEPHKTTWGSGDQSTDFRLFAERMGAYITARSNWLVFVEGAGASCSTAHTSCFWGENLAQAGAYPVRLPVAHRVVYSPHIYSKAVFAQPYFSDPSYPLNMPQIWDEHFGYLRALNDAALMIGEWGGEPGNAETLVWFRAVGSYLTSRDMADNFFWCVNPNSGDTGGLLGYDWSTVDSARVDVISKAQPQHTDFSSYAQGGSVPDDAVSSTAAGGAPAPAQSSSAPAGTGGSCPFQVTDAGSNNYFLAFNVQAPGLGVTSVTLSGASKSFSFAGNWGSSKPAVYTFNPGNSTPPPLQLVIVDSKQKTWRVTVTAFGAAATSTPYPCSA